MYNVAKYNKICIMLLRTTKFVPCCQEQKISGHNPVFLAGAPIRYLRNRCSKKKNPGRRFSVQKSMFCKARKVSTLNQNETEVSSFRRKNEVVEKKTFAIGTTGAVFFFSTVGFSGTSPMGFSNFKAGLSDIVTVLSLGRDYIGCRWLGKVSFACSE